MKRYADRVRDVLQPISSRPRGCSSAMRTELVTDYLNDEIQTPLANSRFGMEKRRDSGELIN